MLSQEELFQEALNHSHVEGRWVNKLDPEAYNEILKFSGRNFGEKMFKFVTGDEGLCTECGKPCRFYGFTEGYRNHKCSSKCYLHSLGVTSQFALPECREKIQQKRAEGSYKNASIKSKETKIARYGQDYAKAFAIKSLNTKKLRYGTASVGMEKRKETNIVRYGPTGRSEKQRKSTQSLYRNFGFGSEHYKEWLHTQGVTNVSQLSTVRKVKQQKKLNSTYNRLLQYANSLNLEPLFQIEDFHGFNSGLRFRCKKCNTEFTYYQVQSAYLRCPHCFPKKDYTSYAQQEIQQYLESLGVVVEVNVRGKLQKNRELDIFLPEYGIAVEYDGLHWHGENWGCKDRMYHLSKTLECEKHGIRLIHIFEDEWLFKQDIVKSRLRYMLGLEQKRYFARKCTIRQVDSKTANIFLDKYHIQGSDKSSIRYGAFYGDELVAIMTFGKLRIALGHRNEDNSYELIRFCTNMSTIPGIAQKLFKHFVQEYGPSKVISYADRRWCKPAGNTVYDTLGFSLESTGSPNYWYFTNNELVRYHRFAFRKNILNQKLSNFNSDLTEWENMKLAGYDRIWDCGSYRFMWYV